VTLTTHENRIFDTVKLCMGMTSLVLLLYLCMGNIIINLNIIYTS